MRRNSKRALGAIGAAGAALAFAAGPALADPGEFRPLTGTGSDTTQYVLGGLGEAVAIGGSKAIGSYDAIGSATIQTRADGPQFVRPNGSGNGVKALTASINPTGTYRWNGVDVTGQLDFARSSSGPSTQGSALTYIPFAKDAVSYAYASFGDASVPSWLTLDDLAAIYKGLVTTYQDNNGATRQYVPVLPQTGSGTRAFFLQQIGVSETQVAWITDTVQENDGAEIDAIGELVPFSVASWVAQSNHVVPNTIDDNIVVLGGIDTDFIGVAPAVRFAKQNAAFPVTRLVYNVVETSRLTGQNSADVLLRQTFAGAQSAVCAATDVIAAYGFGTIPNCGDTTTYRSGYVTP
ncbi:MAG: substrate-binding domain-containing protein [Bifidobacteriaceae bacterium]|nr:substrate-binding domain-containing protein [Bifidobacteriaceae bacterium]